MNDVITRQCPYCHKAIQLNGLEKFVVHMSDVPNHVYCLGTGLHYPTVEAMNDLWINRAMDWMQK